MPRKPYKHVSVKTIQDQLRLTNELLASALPQHVKATLCTMIENLLMDAGMYQGYNQNYWRKRGCQDWMEYGRHQEGDEWPRKFEYICGPQGAKDRDHKSEYVGTYQGEFSRTYYGVSSVHDEETCPMNSMVTPA